MSTQEYPCKNCGAVLKFEPGTELLKCPYCGSENAIAKSEGRVEEFDFKTYLAKLKGEAQTYEVLTVKCSRCGAETTMEPNVTSGQCAFCGTNIVMTTTSQRLIKPQALLPFKINATESQKMFRDWISKLWFAPSGLGQNSRSEESSLKGVYLPHWAYNANSDTPYSGQRGEHYYETETYTETDSKGNRNQNPSGTAHAMVFGQWTGEKYFYGCPCRCQRVITAQVY